MDAATEPSESLRALFRSLAAGSVPTQEEFAVAFRLIMRGQADPVHIASFLSLLHMLDNPPEALRAGVQVLRAHARRVSVPSGAIDIVGTGGDGHNSFNISTASALVVAGAGIPVAKHGSRKYSSQSGSADTLEALGVGLELSDAQIAKALDEARFVFLAAPFFHPAMRHVAPVRKALGFQTLFNLLGPLCNPAEMDFYLFGCTQAAKLPVIAETLITEGAKTAWVVHGADGFDELSTTGVNQVTLWHKGKGISTFSLDPQDYGLKRASIADLRGGPPRQNAEIVRAVLDGKPGPHRDAVLLNAGAALVIAEACSQLSEGLARAAHAIDSGAARETLSRLVKATQS